MTIDVIVGWILFGVSVLLLWLFKVITDMILDEVYHEEVQEVESEKEVDMPIL